MHWDLPHHRAAGFTLRVLRVGLVWPAVSLLHEQPGMHSADVARTLNPDAPNVKVASRTLAMLHRAGIARHGPGQTRPGVHSTYRLTRFGAGMVASLSDLSDWAAERFETADRLRATAQAIELFDKRFAFTLLVVVHNEGCRGIEPGAAEQVVNDLVDTQPEEVRYRLHPDMRHRALNRLRDEGLLRRRPAPKIGRPTRVLYSVTDAGRDLMESLWPMAHWGVEFDDRLSACVGMMTGWWDAPES